MADHDEHNEPATEPAPKVMAAAPSAPMVPPPAAPATPAGNDPLRNPLVLGGAAVVIIGAIAGAYFLGHSGSRGSAPGAVVADSSGRSAAELSARGVCEATLDRAREFGVLDGTASLTSSDPTQTSTQNRVVCNAKSGDGTVKMTVDQLCSDMGNLKCLDIFNITDSTGRVLYQHRDFLPPEE